MRKATWFLAASSLVHLSSTTSPCPRPPFIGSGWGRAAASALRLLIRATSCAMGARARDDCPRPRQPAFAALG
eukprot:3134728-Pyramimonas_sp.AAC.1